MTVPIELAKKAARYEKLMNEANTLFEELEEWANENGYEDFYVDGFGTAQPVSYTHLTLPTTPSV